MKLSEAAVLCEANSRAFIEVYKIYNWKEDDDLRAYCDFILHETVEWMRGFPAAWKSEGLFTKPRAAFHRLLKQSAVVEELGAAYCEQVHGVIWGAFKSHMAGILEKRAGAAKKPVTAVAEETAEVTEDSDGAESVALTAESIENIEMVQCAPVAPLGEITQGGNYVDYNETAAANFKQKYYTLQSVLKTLLSPDNGADENSRLRAALALLISKF